MVEAMIGRAGLRGAAGDATDAPWATPSDLHVDDRYDDLLDALLAPSDDAHTRGRPLA
jgi:hypothetical protein